MSGRKRKKWLDEQMLIMMEELRIYRSNALPETAHNIKAAAVEKVTGRVIPQMLPVPRGGGGGGSGF